MDASTAAAWFGAITGGIGLVWQVVTYFLNKRCTLEIFLEDVKVEKLEDYDHTAEHVTIHASIRNKSEKPTTIEDISFTVIEYKVKFPSTKLRKLHQYEVPIYWRKNKNVPSHETIGFDGTWELQDPNMKNDVWLEKLRGKGSYIFDAILNVKHTHGTDHSKAVTLWQWRKKE